jgi:hypothetical protein
MFLFLRRLVHVRGEERRTLRPIFCDLYVSIRSPRSPGGLLSHPYAPAQFFFDLARVNFFMLAKLPLFPFFQESSNNFAATSQ